MATRPRLLTIGHSNHSWPVFLDLLVRHGVTAIADVRSQPYSRFNPHFKRERLAELLKEAGLGYVFLGVELGARRSEPEAYDERRQARYDLVRPLPAFQRGLDRIRQGVATHQIAVMCAEKDPITCHRTILVCHALRDELFDRGPFEIAHILADGSLESMDEAETRLLALTGVPQHDLFADRAALIDQAYAIQAARIAYVDRETRAARKLRRPEGETVKASGRRPASGGRRGSPSAS